MQSVEYKGTFTATTTNTIGGYLLRLSSSIRPGEKGPGEKGPGEKGPGEEKGTDQEQTSKRKRNIF